MEQSILLGIPYFLSFFFRSSLLALSCFSRLCFIVSSCIFIFLGFSLFFLPSFFLFVVAIVPTFVFLGLLLCSLFLLRLSCSLLFCLFLLFLFCLTLFLELLEPLGLLVLKELNTGSKHADESGELLENVVHSFV